MVQQKAVFVKILYKIVKCILLFFKLPHLLNILAKPSLCEFSHWERSGKNLDIEIYFQFS